SQLHVMESLPNDHAMRCHVFNKLGQSYATRFRGLAELPDLEQAISYFAEAVSLTSEGQVDKAEFLTDLGISYSTRFGRLGNLEDLQKAIECHVEALSLIPDDHMDRARLLCNLGNSYSAYFGRQGRLEDLKKSIEYYETAAPFIPEGDPILTDLLISLGSLYSSRYTHLLEIADLDKSIDSSTRALSLIPKDHAALPNVLDALSRSYGDRHARLQELEDLNTSIDHITQAVSLCPQGHPMTAMLLTGSARAYRQRFEYSGRIDDVLKAIEYQSQALAATPPDHSERHNILGDLGYFYILKAETQSESPLVDVNSAIERLSEAVSLTPQDDSHIPMGLSLLGYALRLKFDQLDSEVDIDTALKHQLRALSLVPSEHLTSIEIMNHLGISYRSQFAHTLDQEHLNKALEYFRNASLARSGDPRHSLNSACEWARLSAANAAPDTLEAYQRCLTLLSQLPWLGSTIDKRYHDLRRVGDVSLEAAAAAISAKQYTLALEWLEQGRSIVWSQVLQLRTPLEQLKAVDDELADNFTETATKLSSAALRSALSNTSNTKESSLEQEGQEHRRLADRYEQLLNNIRQLPGFDDFLRPNAASVLMQAALTGPVVLINVHESRCDALIVLPGKSEVTHTPLPNFSYKAATEARAQLERSLSHHGIRERREVRRPIKPELAEEADSFKRVLVVLWEGIAKPVLESLGYLTEKPVVPAEMPHVTWCATGPLAFLPLHACGAYDGPNSRIFDHVISSYTPTLSALLQTDSPSIPHSSLLAVAQEKTPGQSDLPATTTELAHIEAHAQPPLRCLKLEGCHGTTDAVLTAMEEYDWVHLACHAYQAIDDPTSSGFMLQNGTLSLAAITSKAFKNKGLAFLSACQTAMGDKTLADESVHLASGMLMAGYPSVIATMWSIQDPDAPVIAQGVYARLIKQGKMDYKGTAVALHEAVEELRSSGVGEDGFWRWVPYIHIGVY
ncbi:hypothetical protein FRC11_007449, partial [Ceratobasidium sp. 423]